MLDSGAVKGILENEIGNAIGYLDTETTEQRQKALEYYLRNPYGNEIADGIQAARRLIPRCWFDHKTKQGLDALRNYRREFNEKQNVYYDKPLHDWTSHAADAFRYLAITLDEGTDSWSTPLPKLS